ncbi:PREDICTED: uncharacterized protein LOC106894822 isoform X2 [Calidris pugnax]|uniref:uncharacterized protein LOC106894822 isoform X2 n=1 Tax=Calidris pugnax TaxID=198806 RepID=UPI00071C500C|nr:PREDICTED: uncharacterized protein LOC106894822 isoform X2 [Calidris pugnax]
MELRALLLLPLCFPGLQTQVPKAKERRPEGSSLYIQCPYTEQTDYQQKKAWCRMRGDECEPLVETSGGPTPHSHTIEATKGKIEIVDNHYYNRVTISMTNLQAEDSGTYSCAYRSSNNRYIPFKTISLTVFKGLQTQVPKAKERRPEGSSLYIQCPYTEQTDYQQKKAWCRMRGDECEPLVETSGGPTPHSHTIEATKGKIEIVDNHYYNRVTISMTNLQAEDSGTYSCAYRSSNNRYIPFKTISLTVFKGLQTQVPKAKERRPEGSSLYIQCPYTAQTGYQQEKAWCRVRDEECEPLVETTNPTPSPFTNKATKGNVTIEDDCLYKTVSITMTNLQAQDSGTYSCAYRSNSNQYIPLRTISLIVFKELHKRESDSLSVQCPYGTLGDSTDTKYLCRREDQNRCKEVVWTNYPSTRSYTQGLAGRTWIQDDTQNKTVTITMRNLQAQDSALAQTTVSGTASPTQATPSGNSPPPSSSVHTFRILSGVLGILFILSLISLITLYVRQRKQLKRRSNRQAEDIYDKPEDTAQLDRTERTEIPKNDSEDLQYVTLNHKSQLSPEPPLYCNVEPSQAYRKPKDENVEYAAVALKWLSTNEKG